jgi:hypothetical protein
MTRQPQRSMTARRQAAACMIGLASLLLAAGSGRAADDTTKPPDSYLLLAQKAAGAPGKLCRRVSRLEYESAKQQFLLVNRFGRYVRTGSFWKHYYWYCN